MRNVRAKAGFSKLSLLYLKRFIVKQVVSPNIYNSRLWQTSGHWDHYAENMFRFEVEKEKFGLKPMNCPGHCLIFDHGIRFGTIFFSRRR